MATISTCAATPAVPPPQRRPHSQAITIAAATVRAVRNGPPNQIAAIGSGANASADSIRSRREPASAGANRCSVAPLTPAIIGDRLFEVGAAEIGPQRLGKDQLGIGALPEQEIADALLAAGADKKIRIG